MFITIIIFNIIIISIASNYHYKKYEYEKAYISQLVEFIEIKNIKDQLIFDLHWYLEKLFFHKYIYYLLSILAIEFTTMIPVLNASSKDHKIIVSAFAAIATIFTSIITFTRCSESWLRHRKTFEYIKYELENYRMKLSTDKNINNEEQIIEFYETYCKLKTENFSGWVKQRKENQDSGKKKGQNSEGNPSNIEQ